MGDEPAELDLRFAALGAALAAGSGLARVTRALASVGGTAARPFVPPPIRRAVSGAARQLDQQARQRAAAGAVEARRSAASVAGRVVDDPIVVETIDHLVDRLQWRVIDTVLPVLLDRLAAEPQVQQIVHGQSRTMVEDLARTARERAAAGDESVAGFLERLLHRGARPPAPAAVPSVVGVVAAEP